MTTLTLTPPPAHVSGAELFTSVELIASVAATMDVAELMELRAKAIADDTPAVFDLVGAVIELKAAAVAYGRVR